MESTNYLKYLKYKQKNLNSKNQFGGAGKNILFICGNKYDTNNQIKQINKSIGIDESDIQKATQISLDKFTTYTSFVRFNTVFILCEDYKLLSTEESLLKLKSLILENGIIYFIKSDEHIKQYFIKNGFKIFELSPLEPQRKLSTELDIIQYYFNKESVTKNGNKYIIKCIENTSNNTSFIINDNHIYIDNIMSCGNITSSSILDRIIQIANILKKEYVETDDMQYIW